MPRDLGNLHIAQLRAFKQAAGGLVPKIVKMQPLTACGIEHPRKLPR